MNNSIAWHVEAMNGTCFPNFFFFFFSTTIERPGQLIARGRCIQLNDRGWSKLNGADKPYIHNEANGRGSRYHRPIGDDVLEASVLGCTNRYALELLRTGASFPVSTTRGGIGRRKLR